MIDLHTHTTASDGTFTPSQLVNQAKKNNVTHLAITDHDTVSGLVEAIKAGEDCHVHIIPGIEFSTRHEDEEIHIVGLNIDFQNKELLSELKSIQDDRSTRNERMITRLKELGYDVSLEEAMSLTGGEILTRAHFAKLLVNKGYFKRLDDVFKNLLHSKGRGYIKRRTLSSVEAVKLIKSAGGKAILAHPLLYRLSDSALEQLVAILADAGLDGIEAYYYSFSHEDILKIKGLATKYHLALSGGSDFHGANRPGVDVGLGKGDLDISPTLLDELGISFNE